MNEIISVYADGGVIGKNPSPVGGTWAFCHVNAQGERILERSGTIDPAVCGGAVTNNHTELAAILNAIESTPVGWQGTVYSDSWVSLQRVFMRASMRNVPPWLVEQLHRVREGGRLVGVRYVLLDGHPTREQLASGLGKRGHPVSAHNVWCDQACRAAGEALQRRLAAGKVPAGT